MTNIDLNLIDFNLIVNMDTQQLVNLLIAAIVSKELFLTNQLSLNKEELSKIIERHNDINEITEFTKSFNKTLFYLTKLEDLSLKRLGYVTDLIRLKECYYCHNGEE